MADKQLVLSIFEDEAKAEEAVGALLGTIAVVDDAIGILVLDEHGELKTHGVGATSGGKGLVAGTLLGLLGPVGLGVGAAGGALLGHLHHKRLGLTDADREKLEGALRDGKAAVAVLAEPEDLVAIQSLLVGRGGETEAHELDAAILRESSRSGADR